MNTAISRSHIKPDQGGDDIAAAMALIDEEAKESFWDDAWRGERLKDITEVIWEGFEHENLVELFSMTETAAEGEEITIEEVRGLRVYWFGLGGQIDQSDIDEMVWPLKQNYVGFHVSRHEKKMRNGFSKSASQLQSLAIEQMDAEISARLFRTWTQAIPDGSDYYIGLSGISLAAVETAITEVQDETKDGGVTIVGRGTAINRLMSTLRDENTYAPEQNDELVKMGVVGQYWGATIVKLLNHKDLYERSFFPANEIWVLGKNGSKVGFWGGLVTREYIEQEGWYWHLKGYREAGFAVHKPERARRIIDETLAPGPVV